MWEWAMKIAIFGFEYLRGR